MLVISTKQVVFNKNTRSAGIFSGRAEVRMVDGGDYWNSIETRHLAQLVAARPWLQI